MIGLLDAVTGDQLWPLGEEEPRLAAVEQREDHHRDHNLDDGYDHPTRLHQGEDASDQSEGRKDRDDEPSHPVAAVDSLGEEQVGKSHD